MTGVEVGPFFSPVAPKTDGWKTIVVDFTDANALRKIAREHSASEIRESLGKIEDVDIVWNGQDLDQAVLDFTSGRKIDFVVASHVIEHTTDILRFLQQCSSMLAPSGVISLAVPDMRKCFDLLKSPTSTAEVLGSYRQRRIRHPPETLFAAIAYATTRSDRGAWIEGTRDRLKFAGSLMEAKAVFLEHLKKDESDDYVDAHEWYFTPAGFELVMLELHAMNFIDFAVDKLEPSAGSEFFVQMRREEFALTPSELAERRMQLALRRYTEFAREIDLPLPVHPVRSRERTVLSAWRKLLLGK